MEDRPNGPGTHPIDKYLHVCFHGKHYCLNSSVPSDEKGEEPTFISCRPLPGSCPGIDARHSGEFSGETLTVRERKKLKIAAGIFSFDAHELADMIAEAADS
jgi:hypothetical protein